MKLTQRQIQILAEVGLPTSCEELNDSQKNDIIAIEEMLCYMEKTYNTTVEYKNFTQSSVLNDESLVVVINGKDVTVSRCYEDGKYIYTDNYAEVESTEKYEKAIETFFASKGFEVKVYAEISEIKNGTDDLLSSANASVFVFVCGKKNQSELENLAEAYSAWYVPQLSGVENSTRIYAVSESAYLDIGRTTYYDCLQDVAQENRIICIISADGSITLR